MSKVTLGIARAVIKAEQYPVRFEKFCGDVISDLEGGAAVVMTSANYDQGRDLRSVGGASKIIACCSLTDDVDAKALGDLEKLVMRGTKLDRLYFCSSKSVTERRLDSIKGALRQKLPPGMEIEALSGDQLAERAVKRPELLTKNYPGEVRDALKALAHDDDDTAEEGALRLALATMGSDDTASLRTAVWGTLLRRVLSDGHPRNLNECCRDAAALLRLSRSLPMDVVREQLDELAYAGQVARGERYELTPDGQAKGEEDSTRAADTLFSGRSAVRQELEVSLRYALEDSQFDRLWSALQDAVSTWFYTRGQETVRTVLTVLGEEAEPTAETSTTPSSIAEPVPQAGVAPGSSPHGDSDSDLIGKIASAAAGTATLPQQEDEIRTAVADMFYDCDGAAFGWLLRASAGFVAACSLGMESTSAGEIEKLIARTSLVFDTDVVLSLLCEGEPDHVAVKEIHRRWRELGGTVLVGETVLLEAAWHAWIAQAEFDQVRSWLPGTLQERMVIIRNAFVRSFSTMVAAGKAKMRDWGLYIAHFRGQSATDYSKLKTVLWSDLRFGELPRASSKYAGLKDEAYNSLLKRGRGAHENDEKIKSDKARRDAELFASMVEHLDLIGEAGTGASCYLISSAGRLVRVERKLREGAAGLVLPIPAVSYLLSFAPGVSLGIGALQSFLFDGRWHEHVPKFDLVALRMLKQSDKYTVPWVRRTQLRRELRGRLEAVARDRGKKPTSAEVEKIGVELLRPENAGTAAAIIASALEAVGADSRAERERDYYKKRVEELEAQLKRRGNDATGR